MSEYDIVQKSAIETADVGARKPGPLDEALAALSETVAQVEDRAAWLFGRFSPVLGGSSPETEEADVPPIGSSDVAQTLGNLRHRLSAVVKELRRLGDRAEL